VGAKISYLGRTATGVQVTTSGTCSANDGVNVVSFGDLPAAYLAFTCNWDTGNNGSWDNSDVKFNGVDFSWIVTPESHTVTPCDLRVIYCLIKGAPHTESNCDGQFVVEDVMTHERGHSFGLGHVSEAGHGNLTMSPEMANCTRLEETLGLGDMYGLESLY
jgi:hypothetical protein